MKVWIDLSNSPHPLLFAPVARRLEELGHDVVLTARDNAQTIALARERWPSVSVVGGPSPRSRGGKAWATIARVMALGRWASEHGPDVALSHNSYAQIVAARSLRIPVVTAMDYEHQPANHLAFRLAHRILVPEVFPAQALRRYGARMERVRPYPGLKEVLYLGDFEPDGDVVAALGLSRDAATIVVTRTPPTGALYHRQGNSVYLEALRVLVAQPSVQCVVLPRTEDQRDRLAKDVPGCFIPAGVVDSRSLMYAADLVVGAGGTMTREAALLGVPTYTVFAGAPAAADGLLQREGVLRRLETPSQLEGVKRREAEPHSVTELRSQGSALVEAFVGAVIEMGT